jgi:hypothetical protein
MSGRVAALWRYPVKSMQGERLDHAEVTAAGLLGDRAYAVIDGDTGKVASAKHPRKWARLLDCAARFDAEPSGGPPPAVVLTLPDGTEVRSDDAGVDDVLSNVFGRKVSLTAAAPETRTLEEVWPDIDDLAPAEFIERTTIDREPNGEAVSDIAMALAAPPGTFFDLSPLHLVTTATLEHLESLYPEGRFDPRRYRPNALLEVDGEGFVENDWPAHTVTLGGVQAGIDLVTMRCVMTTLAQPDLPADRRLLQTIAQHNRVEIPGLGHWACAGVYAHVARPGVVRVGDPVVLEP